MTPRLADDWQRINALFHAALDRPAGERTAFLTQACAERPDLQREIEALLAAHARAGSFLDAPDDVTREHPPAVTAADHGVVGRTLGHYRIQRPLGAGGMGVIYLAEDERLGRPVALKAVAPRFMNDPLRLERLRREARAAAALTHPGIATVYALEEFDGLTFIASEYVRGETLRDEVARGPAALDTVIDTGLAIARALAAAHERGIVHRDLKPENVMRTVGGEIKILDFGLARMRDPGAGLAPLTADGSLLGTPGYMSPEQIRGGPIDGRSDLFSLGIVLYELLSGRHPFAGADAASTIAQVLETAPPALTASAPGERARRWQFEALDGIIRACLEKAPSARIPSAAALVEALSRVRAGIFVAPASREESAPHRGAARAGWWWQVHQALATTSYALLLIAVWMARGIVGGAGGRALFLTALIAAIGNITLRLHLWFTWRMHAEAWMEQQARVSRWLRVTDTIFVAALAIGGLASGEEDSGLAALLLSAAVTALVASAVIEPATTRAASREQHPARSGGAARG